MRNRKLRIVRIGMVRLLRKGVFGLRYVRNLRRSLPMIYHT